MVLAFIFLLCPLLAFSQTSIGIDLHSLLCSELKITLGQRLAEHWSISAAVGVNMKILQKSKSAIEEEHNEEFPDGTYPKTREHMHREHLRLCYWPKDVFKGIFLSLGAEHRDTNGLDATVGIGYRFKIWKGINCTLAYDTGLIRATQDEKLTISDLKVCISYTF